MKAILHQVTNLNITVFTGLVPIHNEACTEGVGGF